MDFPELHESVITDPSLESDPNKRSNCHCTIFEKSSKKGKKQLSPGYMVEMRDMSLDKWTC